jgi:hypothetical protein
MSEITKSVPVPEAEYNIGDLFYADIVYDMEQPNGPEFMVIGVYYRVKEQAYIYSYVEPENPYHGGSCYSSCMNPIDASITDTAPGTAGGEKE